jgi:hypothetical protein
VLVKLQELRMLCPDELVLGFRRQEREQW